MRKVKKARWLVVVLTVIMALSLFPAASGANDNVVTLYAGQNIPIGTVAITNDGDNLYVKYVITDHDWCITETHAHIGTSLNGFPLNRGGNPQVGRFDFSKKNEPCVPEYEYTIPLGDRKAGDELLVAAHAVVKKVTGEEEGAWGNGSRFNQRGNWGMWFAYTVQSQTRTETFSADFSWTGHLWFRNGVNGSYTEQPFTARTGDTVTVYPQGATAVIIESNVTTSHEINRWEITQVNGTKYTENLSVSDRTSCSVWGSYSHFVNSLTTWTVTYRVWHTDYPERDAQASFTLVTSLNNE